MSDATLLHLAREALVVILVVSAPPLTASLIAGALSSGLQAITSIQEPTLSVVPKLVAAIITLVATGPWIGAKVATLAAHALQLLPSVGP